MVDTTSAEAVSKHIRAPLAVINELFEESQKGGEFDTSAASEFGKLAQDHFQKVFNSAHLLGRIPLLLDQTPADPTLKDGSLVRFRCMVQDPSYGEELHLSVAHTINPRTGDVKRKFSQYTDAEHPLDDDWEIDYTNPQNVFTEKEVAYCVSIPGQTPWARQTTRESIEHAMEELKISSDAEAKTAMVNEAKYPLHGERHGAALVKFYAPSTAPKVASMIDVVGIYELAYNAKDEGAAEAEKPSWPCVHAIFHTDVSLDSLIPGLPVPAPSEHLVRRDMLLAHLTPVLGGDNLAAHYLLLHLLSNTVNVQGSKVGKLSLNLIGFPSGLQSEKAHASGFSLTNPSTRRVGDALAQFVPRCVELPFDLKLLNSSSFVPNAESGDLKAGVLQLARGTEVVCDETSLHEGTLDEKGVRNLHALQTAILDQVVAYQYPFQPIEMDTNLRVLVLSSGKSILQNDCDLYLSDAAVALFADVQQGGGAEVKPLDPMHTEQIRQYLELVRELEFSIPKDVSDAISEEYAESRKSAHACGSKMMTQAELALAITVARLVSISKGESELSLDSWREAGALEKKRSERNDRARARHPASGESRAEPPSAAAAANGTAEQRSGPGAESDAKDGEPAR